MSVARPRELLCQPSSSQLEVSNIHVHGVRSVGHPVDDTICSLLSLLRRTSAAVTDATRDTYTSYITSAALSLCNGEKKAGVRCVHGGLEQEGGVPKPYGGDSARGHVF